MAPLKVFVSHSVDDDIFCKEFVNELKTADVDVWYDRESSHQKEISAREMETRKIVLFILSPAAMASAWMQDTAKIAYNLLKQAPDRLILTVVSTTSLNRSHFTDVWLFFEEFKRVEAAELPQLTAQAMAVLTVNALALTPHGQVPVAIMPQPTDSIKDLLARGKSLLAQGRHPEAITLFEAATRRDANNISAWFNLGYTYTMLKRYSEAIIAYDQTLALNPQFAAAVWNNKGIALRNLQRYDDAIAAYVLAIAYNPKYAEAWNNKGIALRNLYRYEEAMSAYDRSLALNPHLVSAFVNKGTLFALQDQIQLAEQAFTSARALDILLEDWFDVQDWTASGVIASYHHHYDQALAAFEQASSLNPTYSEVWRYRALTLHQQGKTTEADDTMAEYRRLGGTL